MAIPELTRDIKYESFSILLGFTIYLGFFWVYFNHKEFLNVLDSTWYGKISFILIMAGAGFIFLMGASELMFNYFRDKQLIIRENLIKKYELDKQIAKLPQKYQDEIIKPNKVQNKPKKSQPQSNPEKSDAQK